MEFTIGLGAKPKQKKNDPKKVIENLKKEIAVKDAEIAALKESAEKVTKELEALKKQGK